MVLSSNLFVLYYGEILNIMTDNPKMSELLLGLQNLVVKISDHPLYPKLIMSLQDRIEDLNFELPLEIKDIEKIEGKS